MPVEAQTVQYDYIGDGVSTTFPFPSKFLSPADLIVAKDRVQSPDPYNVTGAGDENGGNVIFVTAPAAGVRVSILRRPPLSQLTDFINGQTVLEGTLDTALDKLTMIVQYLQRQFDRSVRLSTFELAEAEALLTLPISTDRAGKLFTFGPTGAPVMLPFNAFVPDVNASWRVGDTILAYGGLPGLGTPQELPFKNAIQAGGEIYIPPGAWRISSRVTATLTRDVKLIFDPNARVYVDSTITTQAFLIDGQGLYRFIVEGGQFDLTAVPQGTPPNFDQGTCWEIINCPWYDISGGKYVAGNDYDQLKGDAAIAATNSSGRVARNWFIGWSDSALYVTGGALSNDPSDDGGPTWFVENKVIACSLGVSSKRRNRNCFITGNYFFACRVGVGTYYVGAGELEPGDRLTITGNRFKRNQRDIEFKGGNGYSIITNNDFEDFGYLLNGTIAPLNVSVGLYGSKDCLVSDNRFTMVELAGTSAHIPVLTDNFTTPNGPGGVPVGVAYTATGTYGRGNLTRGLTRTVYEGAGVGPSIILNWDCRDASTNSLWTFTNTASEFSCHQMWPGDGGVVKYKHYRFGTKIAALSE